MTPNEYRAYHAEHLKIEKQKVRHTDLLNHILGQYIMVGVNEPKKYPKEPRLAEEAVDENIMTDEQMEQRARRNTIRMGGKINDH